MIKYEISGKNLVLSLYKQHFTLYEDDIKNITGNVKLTEKEFNDRISSALSDYLPEEAPEIEEKIDYNKLDKLINELYRTLWD